MIKGECGLVLARRGRVQPLLVPIKSRSPAPAAAPALCGRAMAAPAPALVENHERVRIRDRVPRLCPGSFLGAQPPRTCTRSIAPCHLESNPRKQLRGAVMN